MQVEVIFDPQPAAGVEGAPLKLRDHPGALDEFEPARRHRPLRGFLAALNSDDSIFATLHCAAGAVPAQAAAPAEAGCEFASEIELEFAAESPVGGFGAYKELVARLHELLASGSADTLHATLRVLRGRTLAIRLAARGASPEQAELRWSLGLMRLQQALLFLSRAFRQNRA